MRAAVLPSVLLCLVLAACGGPEADGGREEAAMPDAPTGDLPDWRALWDHGDPVASEARFREALEAGRKAGDETYVLVVTTQLARTLGKQGRFDEAHATLDGVEAALDDAADEVRVRYLLERGRALNSGGRKDESVSRFREAWDVARQAGLDVLAADAGHMLAIVLPEDEALAWSAKTMAFCEASEEPACKRWLGPLYNNTGWTRFERGEVEQALELWKKGLALREQDGKPEPLFIARYTVARAWRELGRHEEALTEARAIRAGREEAGLAPDGFVAEEIAENLEALGRAEEATPWFERAWKLLSRDHAWLEEHEPERWKRLKARAGA